MGSAGKGKRFDSSDSYLSGRVRVRVESAGEAIDYGASV